MIGRRRNRSGDRLTLALAGTAVVTAGTVIGGELLRLASRRRRFDEELDETPSGVIETAEHAILLTQEATQDAVTVAIEGYQATPRHETILFNLLTGFLGSFALMRLSTTGIRAGWWPTSDVSIRGRHIHHFVPGILLAFAAGGAALFTQDEGLEPTLAFPFGAGLGMTLDEAALLLDFEDVYWTPEGILSVQLSLGASALMAGTILGLRMLRRGEQEAVAQDAIPAPEPLASPA